MIVVNGVNLAWKENYSIAQLLDEIKDNKEILLIQSSHNIYMVNGAVLGLHEKTNYIIQDGDEIKIVPMIGGG